MKRKATWQLLFSLPVLLTRAASIVSATDSLSGCGSTLPKGLKIGGGRVNFTTFASNSSKDNPERAYSVALPVNYDSEKPAPLVLTFHGRGQTNEDVANQTMMSDPYFNKDAITVYPMGINKLWQGDPDVSPSVNDTIFISELIPYLKTQFCVDPDSIYAAGLSNGGGFLTYLACNPSTSSQITAFGAAPLSYFNMTELPCFPNRTAIPILEMHGGKDSWVVYNGGLDLNRLPYTTEGIPDWLADWQKRNKCDPVKKVEILANTTGPFQVKHITWNCTGHDELVTHYYTDNATHVWPTGFNSGYNGTAKMLDFFKRWGGKNLTPASR